LSRSSLDSDIAAIKVLDRNVDSSKSLEQSNFLVQVEVSSMTLKAGMLLLLNHNNQIAILYPLVWDLMALTVKHDFVSVRGALVQGDFVLFLLSFHLLSFTFFA
jgi:hypothetical protein